MIKKCFLFLVILLTIPTSVFSQECSNFSVDHPEWVLCEDWETGSIRSDIWNDGQRSGINSITTQEKFAGTYGLSMLHPGTPADWGHEGKSGGYLNSIGYPPGYTGPLGNGHQKLFLRWYIKFSDNFTVNSKIAGFDLKPDGLSSFWEGRLGAGYRPNGLTSLGGSRIVNGPGDISFYTYYPEMMLDRWENNGLYCRYYGDSRPHPDGWVVGTPGSEYGETDYYCSGPGTDAWSEFGALKSQSHDTYTGIRTLGKNVWRCIEFELKVNDPGVRNGYQRMYLDNEMIGEWTGLYWTLNNVEGKIRGIQLTASSPEVRSDSLDIYSYYDNIVASTQRIGCLGSDIPMDGDDDGDGIPDDPNNPSSGSLITVSGCGKLPLKGTRNSYALILLLVLISTLGVYKKL